MSSLPVNEAQNNLQKLIDQAAQEGKPIIIEGDRPSTNIIPQTTQSRITDTDRINTIING